MIQKIYQFLKGTWENRNVRYDVSMEDNVYRDFREVRASSNYKLLLKNNGLKKSSSKVGAIIILLLFALTVCISPALATSSIAFDSATAVTVTTGAGATHTFAHTTSGSDRILWVIAAAHSAVAVPGQAINSVTYNGTSMTKSSEITNDLANGQMSLWYLIAPATGTHNVVITVAVGGNARAGGAASFTGVLQTGQPDATSTGGPTTTTSYSQSVTSVADGSFAFLGLAAMGGSALTGGTNTTVTQPEVAYHGIAFAYSTAEKTPAGTFTLNVTSASQPFAGVMASFKPVSAPVSSFYQWLWGFWDF